MEPGQRQAGLIREESASTAEDLGPTNTHVQGHREEHSLKACINRPPTKVETGTIQQGAVSWGVEPWEDSRVVVEA